MGDSNDFFEKVYAVVRQIPEGRVSSYGAIAKSVGAAKSARMVGYALHASIQNGVDIPAHRVVNRNGLLTGKFHFFSDTLMEQMLHAEGVLVENDRVVDFKRLFWNPSEHINDLL
ncbi:MAG: MGMT family protein [Flavobacteriales bacterium]|nr:MAG: MGMT family protein [Flavobacteriales bacterium]